VKNGKRRLWTAAEGRTFKAPAWKNTSAGKVAGSLSALKLQPVRKRLALIFGAEHGRSAKRSHVAAICTNTVLSWGVLTD
jgi:hypothetical protein